MSYINGIYGQIKEQMKNKISIYTSQLREEALPVENNIYYIHRLSGINLSRCI